MVDKVRKVPEDEIKRVSVPGNVILVVKKQEDATKLSDYIACIKDNGERVVSGEPLYSDVEEVIDNEWQPITDVVEESQTITEDTPIDDKEPTEDKQPTDEEKEEEEEPIPIPIKDWIKKGVAIGISALLAVAILGTKEKTHQTVDVSADRTEEEAVSDIVLIEVDGQYIQYIGSVYKDPGTLIRDMRDAALGEDLLFTDARNEILANTTEESRIAEEETILEISNQFQEQQSIIFENEQILNSSASESEKAEAIQKIIDAKKEIQTLYRDNYELYVSYANMAKAAHSRYGGDERTEQENEMVDAEVAEYNLSIQDLNKDIISLNDTLYVVKNPRVLFDEEPAPEGTVTTAYIIDAEIAGQPIQLGEISSTEVIDLEYTTSARVDKEGETKTSGTVVVDAGAIQKTETTRKGIFAVLDIIQRRIQELETGEITILGHKVHDDPHIK